jgi:hypothetical protein
MRLFPIRVNLEHRDLPLVTEDDEPAAGAVLTLDRVTILSSEYTFSIDDSGLGIPLLLRVYPWDLVQTVDKGWFPCEVCFL